MTGATQSDSLLPDKSSLSEDEKRIAQCYVRTGGKKSKSAYEAFLKQLRRRGLFRPKAELDALTSRPAFRVYVQRARNRANHYVKKALNAEAPKAVEDYVWARETAKEAGDYKEVRQGAQDLFDRIGVVGKKETETVNKVVVFLKGRTFDADTLDRALPEVTAEEIIIEDPEIIE